MHNLQQRVIDFFCHLFFIALISMAIFTNAGEYSFFFDDSPGLITILQGNFYIVHERFPYVVVQILPKIGEWLGLPIEQIGVLLIINVVMLFYLGFVIIRYYLLDTLNSLGFTLGCASGFFLSYYVPLTFAPPYGCLLFMVSAVLSNNKNRSTWMLLFLYTLVIFYLSFLYLPNILLILFVLVSYYLENKKFPSKMDLLYVILFLVFAIGRFLYSLIFIEYDKRRLSEIMFKHVLLPDVFFRDFLEQFIMHVLNNNVLFVLFLFLSVFQLLISRRFLLLINFLIFLGITFVLYVLYTVPGKLYVFTGIIWGWIAFLPTFGFSNYFLKNMPKIWIMGLGTFSIIYGLYNIHLSASILKPKLDYLKRTVDNVQQFEESKFLIHKDVIEWDFVMVPDYIPMETLVLSSSLSFHNKSNKVITATIFENFEQIKDKIRDTMEIICVDWVKDYLSYDNLNYKYFSLKKTNSLIITHTEEELGIEVDSIPSHKVKIICPDTVKVKHMPLVTQYIEVEILNESSIPMPARRTYPQNFTSLSYHVYSILDSLIINEGYRTSLECDILPGRKIKNALVIKNPPLNKGVYKLEIDLVTEERRWWNINKKVVLVVN